MDTENNCIKSARRANIRAILDALEYRFTRAPSPEALSYLAQELVIQAQLALDEAAA